MISNYRLIIPQTSLLLVSAFATNSMNFCEVCGLMDYRVSTDDRFQELNRYLSTKCTAKGLLERTPVQFERRLYNT